MKKLIFKEVFNKAWEIFKKNWKTLLLLSILSILVQIPFNIADYLWQDRFLELGGIYAVATFTEIFFYTVFMFSIMLISFIISYNIFKIYLKIYDGHKHDYKEMFNMPTKNFWKYLGANILYCILVFVGFILFIIPGIYFMIRYAFAPLFVLEKKSGVLESFKQSSEITDGYRWKLFEILLITILACIGIIIVGLICLIVGVIPAAFIAGIIAVFSYIDLYKKLS